MEDTRQSKRGARRLAAGALAAALLLGLWGCEKQQTAQQDPPEQTEQDKPETPETKVQLPDHEGPLTEEEYKSICQQYYDELMTASNEASLRLDEAVSAPSETEEQQKTRQKKMDIAMGLVEQMPPLYTRFIELEPPEIYAEAHALISSGATASGEVLRLTAAIAKSVKEEAEEAETLALQAELETYTSEAQNFARGLRMVLGEQVGVGEDSK